VELELELDSDAGGQPAVGSCDGVYGVSYDGWNVAGNSFAAGWTSFFVGGNSFALKSVQRQSACQTLPETASWALQPPHLALPHHSALKDRCLLSRRFPSRKPPAAAAQVRVCSEALTTAW